MTHFYKSYVDALWVPKLPKVETVLCPMPNAIKPGFTTASFSASLISVLWALGAFSNKRWKSKIGDVMKHILHFGMIFQTLLPYCHVPQNTQHKTYFSFVNTETSKNAYTILKNLLFISFSFPACLQQLLKLFILALLILLPLKTLCCSHICRPLWIKASIKCKVTDNVIN